MNQDVKQSNKHEIATAKIRLWAVYLKTFNDFIYLIQIHIKESDENESNSVLKLFYSS